MTLREFGEQVGLSYQRVSSIEAGNIGKRKNKNLAKFADYFDKTVEELIDEAIKWSGEGPKYLEEKEGEKPVAESLEKAVGNALIEDPRLRLIDKNVERLLELVEQQNKSGGQADRDDPHYESTELKLDIPDPPPDLPEQDARRYDQNAGLLMRWARTEKARQAFPAGVPRHVLGRFCQEVIGFYHGGWLDDITGLLKEYVEEYREARK